MKTLEDLANELRQSDPNAVAGISKKEVVQIMSDQNVARVPTRYAEFLSLMGRRAGRLLAGTDAFYPDILGLKQDAFDLLEIDDCGELIPEGSLVIAMHQGYQVYWMSDLNSDDPPVYMYQEGDREISKEWGSFSSFLWDERDQS